MLKKGILISRICKDGFKKNLTFFKVRVGASAGEACTWVRPCAGLGAMLFGLDCLI